MKKFLLPIVLVVIGVILLVLNFIMPRGAGELDVDIQSTSFIMPAAYKVYANEEALEGRFYLCQILLTNEGSGELNDLEVSYEIPGFIDQMEVDDIKCLGPGMSAVITIYPKFDPSVVDVSSTSKERAKITIDYKSRGKSEEYDKTFAFEMRGRNDLVYSSLPSSEIVGYQDMFENLALVPCFITPEDPIIKYYTQQIQQKVLKGEAASVNQTPEEAVRFLLGVYNATLSAGMVYSGTLGIPVNIGDVSSLIQHIRLPREVVTGNTGLCIELSTLYASVLSCAGLNPIIYMIPGHAYPGFELNGNYFAIEATGIGGEGLGGVMTAEQAYEQGMKQLQEFFQKLNEGDPRYMYVDVHELYANGVRPMELKDDNFMRQKVDQIAGNFGKGTQKRATNQNTGNHNNTGNTGGGRENTGGSSGMASYSGSISFNYPMNWSRMNYPVQEVPILESQIQAMDGTVAISVYNIQGASNANEAMAYIQQTLGNLGMSVAYQQAGSSGNLVKYIGETSSYGDVFTWVGFCKKTANGVACVAIGSPSYYYNQTQNTINQIASTIR